MQATQRLVAILESLSVHEHRTLAQIAVICGLPKSTAFRFLHSLAESGWVEQDAAGAYGVGPAALGPAQAFLALNPLGDVAAPLIATLRDRTGETVSLSSVAGNVRVCIKEFASRHALRYVHEVGSVAPLHAGASGKLLIAYLDEHRREMLLSGELARYSSTTITDPVALRAECEQICRRGWSLSFGERSVGSVAIAVPVRTGADHPVAALAVFCPAARFDQARDLGPWITALRSCADAIEQRLPSVSPERRNVVA